MSSEFILQELQEWRAEAKRLRKELDTVGDVLEDLLLILDAHDIQTAIAVIHRALRTWEKK